MPHISVKLYPGRSEQEKSRLDGPHVASESPISEKVRGCWIYFGLNRTKLVEKWGIVPTPFALLVQRDNELVRDGLAMSGRSVPPI